jgi:putative inorganic carbon (hco3(-)) transporter
VIVSPLPARSWAALPPLALGLLLYVCLAKLPLGARQLVWAGRCLAAAAIPVCLITPLGMPRWILPIWARPFHTRVHLPQTFNANIIAGVLVLLLPFCAVQIWSFRTRYTILTWIGRGTWLLITCISLWLLWRTQSRGAHSAIVIAALALVELTWPKIARWMALPAMAGGIVTGTIIGWRQVLETLLNSPATHGIDVREEIWSRALMIAHDFPLTGIGLGCFEPVVATLYPLVLIRGGTATHAHNLVLQVAVDLGLPGLIAYLAILGLSWQLLWLARQELDQLHLIELHGLATACFLALIGMVTHGMIDSAVWDNKGAFVPWMVMGLAAGLYRYATNYRGKADG